MSEPSSIAPLFQLEYIATSACRCVIAAIILQFTFLSVPANSAAQFKRLEGQDIPQGDIYDLRYTDRFKDMTLPACETACAKENACQSYTWNKKNGWCFLKDRVNTSSPHPDAVSGIKKHEVTTVSQIPVSEESTVEAISDVGSNSAPPVDETGLSENSPPKLYRVQNLKLNARSGPGADHEVITRLEANDPVKELARKGEWSNVVLPDGRIAWIHNGYITEPFDIDKKLKRKLPIPNFVQKHLKSSDYVIRPRLGLSGDIWNTRFDEQNGLLWVSDEQQVRAYNERGSLIVSTSMPDEKIYDIFAQQFEGQHPLQRSSTIAKKDGSYIASDKESGKTLFRFDFARGKGDKALFAHYLDIKYHALAYAYYASGKIRIWDIESKSLVSEYLRPRGFVYTDGPKLIFRYINVSKLKATRKLTKQDQAGLRKVIKAAWTDGYPESWTDDMKNDLARYGAKMVKENRVFDLITGTLSGPRNLHFDDETQERLYAQFVKINGRMYEFLCLTKTADSASDEWDWMELRDYEYGKLVWSQKFEKGQLFREYEREFLTISEDQDMLILGLWQGRNQSNPGDPADEHRLRLYRLSTGKLIGFVDLAPIVSRAGDVNRVSFSTDPDGSRLVVGGLEGEVLLYDLAERKELWRTNGRAFRLPGSFSTQNLDDSAPYQPDLELDKPLMKTLLAGETPAPATESGSDANQYTGPGEMVTLHEAAGLAMVKTGDSYVMKDLASGDNLYSFKHFGEYDSYGVAFSPAGKMVAIVSGLRDEAGKYKEGYLLRILDARSGGKIAELTESEFPSLWFFDGEPNRSGREEGFFRSRVIFGPNDRWVFVSALGTPWRLFDLDKDKRYGLKKSAPAPLDRMFFDPHGNYFSEIYQNGQVHVTDLRTLKRYLLGKAATNNIVTELDSDIRFSKDGSRAVFIRNGNVSLYDMKSKKPVASFPMNKDISGGDYLCYKPLQVVSDDGSMASFLNCEGGTVRGEVWDLNRVKPMAEFDFAPSRFSPDGQFAYGATGINHVHVASLAKKRKLAEAIGFEDGSWVTLTPEGFFNAEGDGAKHLSIIKGTTDISIDQAYDVLFRPDLVKEALLGDPHGKVEKAGRALDLASVLQQGLPPKVKALTAQGGAVTNKSDLTLEASVKLQSGGLGRIEIRVNGTLQNACDPETGACRGLGAALQISSTPTDPNLKSIQRVVKLRPGKNLIEMRAYDKHNQIASIPARLVVTANIEASGKPELYILAVGVNNYYDSALKLQYALSDANGIVDGFSKSAEGAFEAVHVTKVFDEQATREGIEAAFEAIASKAKSEDVFLFYVAGHGKSKEGHYYYLPYDFVDKGEGSLERQGIGREVWREWFSHILAEKSVLLYDTCESGSLVSHQARSLSNRAVADRLKRATGRSTMAATSEEGVALEGIGGHGVFTYTVLEGLSEADADNDAYIELTELAGYIQKRLPDLSHEYFGYRQIPETQVVNSFPLGQKITKVVQSSSQFIPSTSTHVVIANTKVRATPDEAAEPISNLAPGTLIRSLKETSGWSKVARNGKLLGFVPTSAIVAQQ